MQIVMLKVLNIETEGEDANCYDVLELPPVRTNSSDESPDNDTVQVKEEVN